MRLFTIFLLAVLIMGCETSRVFVNYKSSPAGAILYCDGERYGNTPIQIEHKLSDKESKQDFFTSRCNAIWVSGATSSEAIKINTKKLWGDMDFDGSYKKTSYTFKRPDYPNIIKDEEFAIKVLQLEATKHAARASRQAQIAAKSAASAARQASQKAEEARLQSMQRR